MATRYSPKITTRGLVFLLDPHNNRCVQPGNTSAHDLVGSKRCSGASGEPGTGAHTEDTNNFPTIAKDQSTNSSSYVFGFDGSDGINIDEDLGSNSECTAGMWFFKTSTANDYLFDFRNDGGSWWLTNYSSYNINIHNTLRYNFGGGSYSAGDFPTNVWVHLMITSDSSGSKIYLNGRERTAAYSTSVNESFGINARIGTRYTYGGHWDGKMGPIYLYNKVLTAAEVKQNFLAHVGRYLDKLCPESSF